VPYDGLGSTAALTDSSGNVVNRYVYRLSSSAER